MLQTKQDTRELFNIHIYCSQCCILSQLFQSNVSYRMVCRIVKKGESKLNVVPFSTRQWPNIKHNNNNNEIYKICNWFQNVHSRQPNTDYLSWNAYW